MLKVMDKCKNYCRDNEGLNVITLSTKILCIWLLPPKTCTITMYQQTKYRHDHLRNADRIVQEKETFRWLLNRPDRVGWILQHLARKVWVFRQHQPVAVASPLVHFVWKKGKASPDLVDSTFGESKKRCEQLFRQCRMVLRSSDWHEEQNGLPPHQH